LKWRTESTKSWDNVALTAKDLMVLTRITSQLNEDAVISVGDDLAALAARAPVPGAGEVGE
jgi:hypothetical protein